MSKIIVLDELTASQIAAGEVIERPASVVKETVENSIDAGATEIRVEIRSGGVKYIKVTDNGSGFEADDAVIAFDKHATSKIRSGEDLEDIHTLGFRGEALASIAAVSDVTLISRTQDAQDGIYVHIKGGDVIETDMRASKKGTSLTIQNLFYNTPARFKFLKKDQTEGSYVCDVIQKIALAHPEVSLRLSENGNEIIRTPGNGSLKDTIYSIYGREIVGSLLAVNYCDGPMTILGFVGVREAVFGTRGRQIFLVNGRCVGSKIITSALDEAYKTVTMKHRFPMAILNINLPGNLVDVNVHPTKSEVRFADENGLFRAVYHGVNNALLVDNRTFGKIVENSENPVENLGENGKHLWKTIPSLGKTSEETSKNSHYAEYASVYAEPTKTEEKKDDNYLADFSPKTEQKNVTTTKFDQFFETKNDVPFEVPCETKSEPKIPCETKNNQIQNTTCKTQSPVYVAPTKTESQIDSSIGTESFNSTYNENDVYTDAKIVGQAFDTFLILEKENNIILIDQHAAHERLKYEEIRASLEARDQEPTVSPMLIPITITLTPAEYAMILEYLEHFTKLGFEIDDFGKNTIIVRAIPSALMDADIEDTITEALDAISSGRGPRETLFRDEAVYTMACKAAIKANHHLSDIEITELLKNLAKLPNSGTCPHGRPIFIKMSKYELERKFKRIV